MSEHADNITFVENEEDIPYLKSKLFDVNMRLFRNSQHYQNLVKAACDHISWLCLAGLDGYKLPHGMSGANAGIPWNIIGIARNRGQKDAWCEIMINPKIIGRSKEKIESDSNCGSIRLKKPIKIRRNAWVDVIWFDIEGKEKEASRFHRETGGLTIQHEIDHNLGILITDRAK